MNYLKNVGLLRMLDLHQSVIKRRCCGLALVTLLLLRAIPVAYAQNFSDNFTRTTNSTSVLPWQIQTGNWLITNGVFRGGPNLSDSYGFTYITNSLTNYSVTADFNAVSNAFGFGLGARLNPASGAHYGAWIYPESSPFTPSKLRLIKFPDWGTSSFTILGTVNIAAISNGVHSLTMVLDTNLINVYLNGALQISVSDNSSPYLSGGVSVDMYTYSSDIYSLTVDNVSAAQLNYLPNATNDFYTIRGDMLQAVASPGVLYNDRDPDGTNLIAVLVDSTVNGTLSLSSNGGFTYIRTNGTAYYDSFSYRASDGVSTSGVATVLLSLTSGGAFFADDFTRATNPASLLPWTAHAGNWSVTNGLLEGGTNLHSSYGSVFRAASWTNFAVEGSFLFPTNGYGGGIAGRVNPTTGQRYVAWLYPELSDRGPNNIRIAKFQNWDSYGLFSFSNAQAMATISLNAAVITNTWHTLKLAFQANQLAVYYDGLWLTNVMDMDTFTNSYASGGVAVDFFTYTNNYLFRADNITSRPLVSDDNYEIAEEATLTITAGFGVLTNDTSINGQPLSATLISGPANGTLSLSTNGSFTYTPAVNFIGTDSFIYEARQSTNSLGAAIVNIVVNSANDAPQLPVQPDYFVAAGGLLLITNTAADSDVPADILTYQLADAPGGMIVSTNGIISWTPTLAQSPSTNVIQTIVTDNGLPPLSDTNLITVVVTNPPGIYQNFVFFENFDAVTAPALPAGWTTSQSGSQLIWFTQTALRNSLPNAAFSSEANTNGVNELLSPVIALPVGSFQLHFRNSYDLETHPSMDGLAFDGAVLEIKIGAGAFADVVTAGGTFIDGGYTHTISPDFGNPLAGRAAWSGNSGGFVTTSLALPPSVSGQTVQFRWRCGTDSATSGNGWAVDDVGVTNFLCCNLFAPVFPPQNNIVIGEFVALTVTNTATDGDLPSDHLTYTLTAFPAGSGITTNGVISWTPTEAQGPMVATFTTVVSDKGGLKATNSFNVTVNEVNQPPQFSGAPTNRTIAENTLLTVTNSASDSDLPVQGLTYTLVSAPAGASVTTNGVITWTPTEAQGPSTNVIATVISDGVVSVTNSFTVIVTEVNVAPSFVGVPVDTTINELSALAVTNSATDSDLPVQTLIYTLMNAPAGASITTNGVITWTPTEAQGPSTNTLTTVVSDGAVSITNSFVVTVSEVNVAPGFVATPANTSINELNTLTVTNNATDSDVPAQVLTYTLMSAPASASITTNGVITWTPTEAQGPSTNTLTTVVSDGVASTTNSFVVTVTEANQVPVLPTQTNHAIAELGLLIVTNTATDADLPAQALTYQLLSPPANAMITSNGVIVWRPAVNQGGFTNTFTTVVNDGSASATNSFSVAVTDTLIGLTTNVTLISTGAVWSYLDNGSDQGSAWGNPEFDASSWSNGPAQLGYGDGDEQTVVSFGTNSAAKHITTYFRRTFTVADANYFSALNLRVLRDDGVMVYLNGVEVYRNNMPAGAVNYLTLAPASISGTEETTFLVAPLDLSPLVTGTNVIAVEMHQNNVSSTDLSFDLELTAALNLLPPTLLAQADRTLAELTLLTVTNMAADLDSPTNELTYQLLNPPGNAAINASGVITWAPQENEGPGTNILTTIVSDGTQNATNSFTVIVTEVNVAPSFVATPVNTNINEGVTLTVTNSATDSDLPAQTLTYTLVSAPSGANITTNGVITWTPSEAQGPSTNVIVTTVSDGVASVTNSFEVVVTEVNVSPSFVSTPANTNLNEGVTLTVTNSATDSDLPVQTLTYTLVSAPVGASVTSNGVITWTPSEAQGPSTNVIVTAVSDGVASVTNNFTVIVSEVNVAPVFTTTPANTNSAELTTLTVTNSATDSDLPAQTLTYTLVSAPSGANITTNGVITWTPSEAQGPSTNVIVTTVSDGVASVTNSFEVVVTEVNSAPSFVATPSNTNIAEGVTLTVTNSATDSDVPAQVVSYALVSAPVGASITTNGVITWTPSEAQGPSTNVIATAASDGVASVTNSFEVVVTEVNVAPSFVATPVNTNINEGVTLTVTNNATDSDLPAQTLTYALVTAPAGASITTNGVITWTPTEAQGPSTNTIATAVSDGVASVTNSFTVIVTEVNSAPSFVATPSDATFAENTLLTVTNSATDSDLPVQVLTYTLVAAPAGASITTNGVITWMPTEAQGPSTNTIATAVSDGVASVTNSFSVIVTEVNTAPSFVATPVNTNINEGVTLTVTNSATDSDLPAQTLAYTLVSAPSGANITTNGVITWTPSEAQGPSTNVIATAVSDGVASVTNSFEVVVLEVNVSPSFVSTPANTNLNEGVTLTVTNSATDSDLPVQTLTYTLVSAPVGASVTTNGVITWTPSEAQGPSTNVIATAVSDGSISVTNNFTVIVTEVNVAPSFVSTPANTNLNEGVTLTVTNSATDSDLPVQTLTYTLVSAPAGASITTNGIIAWTPTEAQGPSTNTIATAVSDGVASVTNSFEVVVTEVNVSPSFVSTPANTNLNEGVTLTVTNSATDSDLPVQVLTYSLLVAPTNAAISSSGVITWTPTEAQGPSTNIFATVVNDGIASATNSFSVVVAEVNLAPVATNDSYFLTNAVLTVAANGILANDSDADLPANTLTAALVSGPTNGVLNLSSNGGFSYTPNAGFSGLDVFTYRANDGLANSAVATVSITVSNRPFVITSVAVNAGLATVTWNSTPGLSYRVQYLSNLNSTNWTDVNPVVTATNISASVTNFVGSDPQRFYRVKMVETPQPVILSLQVTNGIAVITWSSVATKDYQLQYKTNLTDAAWTEVAPNINATAATTTTTNAVGTTSQRFFRIRLMP